jgi:hypothetical protein
MLDTEFVRALIESFYDEQKFWLMFLGWFPYTAYLVVSMTFGESEAYMRLNPEYANDYYYDPLGFATLVALMLLIGYLIWCETKQIRQLGWDYLDFSNLIDWTTYGINIVFAINRYTKMLTISQMMKLSMVNFAIIWGTFVFWLRLFENYVLYI